MTKLQALALLKKNLRDMTTEEKLKLKEAIKLVSIIDWTHI